MQLLLCRHHVRLLDNTQPMRRRHVKLLTNQRAPGLSVFVILMVCVKLVKKMHSEQPQQQQQQQWSVSGQTDNSMLLGLLLSLIVSSNAQQQFRNFPQVKGRGDSIQINSVVASEHRNTGLWLVNTDHVTWILASDWLIPRLAGFVTDKMTAETTRMKTTAGRLRQGMKMFYFLLHCKRNL